MEYIVVVGCRHCATTNIPHTRYIATLDYVLITDLLVDLRDDSLILIFSSIFINLFPF